MSLSKNLKKIRKENNLSQEQLADKLGVSRQAVSKWESGQAYPEMEKMLVMCKMFNLNIDELLNQDIGEIDEVRQSKNNINKYIDDFLGIITKTIGMFSSMSFKTKVKCIFEQFVIFVVLFIMFLIIGSIGTVFIQDILMILPDNVYYVIYRIIADIYMILCSILGAVLMLHIFKVRYLDYYVIDKEDILKNDERIEEVKEEVEGKVKNKIYLEKKQTRVIIRDPENAGYKFISLLFKCVLFGVKVFVEIFGSVFCLSLIFLCLGLVLAFLFVKTGFVFVGTLLVILSAIMINLVVLDILYNFIVSKKSKKNKLALCFCLSLVMLGVGSGLFLIGITDFKVMTDYDNLVEEEITLVWQDDLVIGNWYNVNYIESDNEDIKIVYKHSCYYEMDVEEYDNFVHFSTYSSYNDVMEVVRSYIANINDKKIVDYSYVSVDVYTNQDNILRLKRNSDEYFG